MKTQYFTATSIDGYIADENHSLDWLFQFGEVDGLRDHYPRFFVEGDVSPVHAEMLEAADGGNVWIVGGGDLVGQFHDAGLLDELILFVASVTLGAGAPLLPRRIITPPLKLTGAERHEDAFAVLTYDVQRTADRGR